MLSELTSSEFYRFVREERQFCAALAHLLMQKGDNLLTFVQLINQQVESQVSTSRIVDVQIYVEFSFLRDYWNEISRDRNKVDANAAKRQWIFELMRKVPSLALLRSADFPESIPQFNASFMGKSGLRVLKDIASPRLWSVGALDALSLQRGFSSEQFRDLCKFKWSFNIKPDLVILIPGAPVICIEAKLESKEGYYPIGGEAAFFNRHFAPRDRVRQIELQQFMFEVLLDASCQQFVLTRTTTLTRNTKTGNDIPGLTWQAVLESMNLDDSIEFVKRLVQENRFITAVYTRVEEGV